MKRKLISLAIVVCSILAAGTGVFAGQTAKTSPKSQWVERGRKLYNQYCASCHGPTGKGDGPVAAALKSPPPDLTAIQQAGEKFPFDRVQTKIDGEKSVAAHGTSQMPVWGTIFKPTRGELRHADVYALAKYIESIQLAK